MSKEQASGAVLLIALIYTASLPLRKVGRWRSTVFEWILVYAILFAAFVLAPVFVAAT
ncbi:MAG: hypothetical protein ACO1SV_07670 [Fimbriimonas sp.]